MAEVSRPDITPAGTGPAHMVGHLRGGWLWAARLLWLALAAGALLLFVLSVPVGYRLLLTPCEGPECHTEQLSAEGVAALAATGLSLPAYAAFNVALAVGLVGVCTGAALLIVLRRSDEPVALYVSLTLLLLGIFVNTFNEAVTTLGVVPLVAADIYSSLMWVAFPILFYLFPDGRFVPRWTVLPALGWLYVQAIYFVAYLYRPAVALNPGNWPEGVQNVLYVGLLGTCLYAQIHRYRRVSDAGARQQTKWVVFGLLLAAGVILLAELLPELLDPALLLAGSATNMALDVVAFVALALIPVTLSVAILRYRLWDIDVLIRRTLSYSLLTLGLAAAYFASVVVLQTVFNALTGEPPSALVTVLSTLTIAALFTPLRARVQAFIDRRFYRRKYDAARTLAVFSATARDEVDLSALSGRLLAVVHDTMQPAHLGLWLRGPATPPEPPAP